MNEPSEINHPARRQGQTLACEGILRGDFGRRPSRAVDRAVAALRVGSAKTAIISFQPEQERIPRNDSRIEPLTQRAGSAGIPAG